MIRPDRRPELALAGNLFFGLGYLYIGDRTRALIAALLQVLTYVFALILSSSWLGIVLLIAAAAIPIAAAYDGWQRVKRATVIAA